MIEEFIKWWGAQLFDLVPARFKTTNLSEGDALVAEILHDGEVQLYARRNRHETSLGRFPLNPAGIVALRAAPPRQRPGRVVLRAPAAVLLERQVVLPLAAERDHASVLRFEMDRLTPFAAEDVFWSAKVERRDTVRGKLMLLLSMIPKAALNPAIAALREAGLEPAAIEAPAPSGGTRLIGIARVKTGASGRIVPRVLSGVCAALALIAIILPFALQSRRAAAIADEIARLRPAVTRAEALRRRILAGTSGANVIAHERARVGDPLALLAAVTNALPDDTFLTEMTLRRLKLNLAGQSSAAAALLSALSANPMLSNAAFSSPVTRDSADHKDLFSVKATVVPTMSVAR